MKMLQAVLVLVSWLPMLAHGQTTDVPEIPELRVVVGPQAALATNGYVEGQLVLRVQLVSRHPFEALDLKTPVPSGTEMIELLRPRTRKVSSYAGEGYVFETAIAIIPRESGILTIPPVTVQGMIEPKPGGEVRFDLASAPVEVKISGISPHFDDREESPWWLVADRVEIDEEWSSPVEEIRVGQILERRISLRVWGTNATRLPELEHPRTRGIRVALASVEVATEKSAEGLIATADYVWNLEAEPGQVAFISPMAVTYWHPQEHRQRRAGVPGHRLEPLPADSAAIAARLMREAVAIREGQSIAAIMVLGVVLAPMLLFAAAMLHAWLPSRADRKLRAACGSGVAPAPVYRALEQWSAETGKVLDASNLDGNAYRSLLDHLFAPGHPSAGDSSHLASLILRQSRAKRVETLLARVSRFVNPATNQACS